MGRALFLRLAFLAVVGLGAWTWWWLYDYGQDYAQGSDCNYRHEVIVVRVPASSVDYARSKDWPRVLMRDMELGAPMLYDHAKQVEPIRRRASELCPHQRFRLAAR